jgi:hypothetical protein
MLENEVSPSSWDWVRRQSGLPLALVL